MNDHSWILRDDDFYKCTACNAVWRKGSRKIGRGPGDIPQGPCPAEEGFRPGVVVDVHAWWTSGLVSCEIMSLSDANNCTVKPLKGHPHWRCIKRNLIVGWDANMKSGSPQ